MDMHTREETYLRNIEQINALIDYIRRSGLNALNEYQKDKVLGLTTRQGMAITTVHRMTNSQDRGVTLSSFAREMHMSISAASHLVDALVEHNLLTRSQDEEDRRIVRISLSPAGNRCAAVAKQGILNCITSLTSQLTPEEEEMRLRVIEKLYHTIYPAA